jgi:hypothetical protein
VLIFDNFPDRERADAFAAFVELDTGLAATVYDDADEARAADPFPFELVPPVVHVEVPDDEAEVAELDLLVLDYGGKFAGT